MAVTLTSVLLYILPAIAEPRLRDHSDLLHPAITPFRLFETLLVGHAACNPQLDTVLKELVYMDHRLGCCPPFFRSIVFGLPACVSLAGIVAE